MKIRKDTPLGVIRKTGPLPIAACVQPHSMPNRKTSSLLEWLSASKFPFRHPVLYGLFLELRSFVHRIRSLRKPGDIRPLQISSVYQQSSESQHLRLNTETQARSEGKQKLLADSRWATTEDCRLFLAGWEAAGEWYRSLDIGESGVKNQLPSNTSQAAGGPFKPDFGLSGVIRRLDRVFPLLARAGVRSIRTRFRLVPRRPLRDGESCSTASLRGARTIPFSPGSNECSAVSLQTAHDCER